MKQLTLATERFERYAKTTRRAVFLAAMGQVVPRGELCALIEPVYPKPGNGRRPVGLERMLRLYFVQQWFNLSDPAVEEALYESSSMRSFVGTDLGCEAVPDETTVCRFRHLLEAHELGRQLFEQVHRHLEAQGFKVTTGTIVDATIINAPSSTKNRDRARDPDMHQTKKGNQWYFGMKAHLGVDSQRPRSSIRWWPLRPTSPMRRCCPICSMAGRLACGATRPIADNARSSERVRRRPATSRTGATAAGAGWMKSSGRRPNQVARAR